MLPDSPKAFNLFSYEIKVIVPINAMINGNLLASPKSTISNPADNRTLE